MATIGNGAIISLNIDGRLDAQQVLLTTHWRMNLNGSGAPEQAAFWPDAALAFESVGSLFDVYPDVLSSDVTFIGWVFQILYPVRYVKFTGVMGAPAGAVGVSALPPGTAHAITLRGEAVGRTKRGVKHIGGVPNTFSENGMLAAVAITPMNNLSLALSTVQSVTHDGEEYLLEPVVYHRAAPNTSEQILYRTVMQETRTMRRRVVGRGT